MTTENTTATLAERGVDAAEKFLERKGYEILAKNWQCDAGEIELVAHDDNDDALCFVEVKTRHRSGESIFPCEAISSAKREKLESIAFSWLMENSCEPNIHIRFDVISLVVLDDNKAFLRWHINALGDA